MKRGAKMARVCEIPLDNSDNQEIKDILNQYRKVAVIGLSNNEEKPSHQVGKYLKENGFKIYPVNPGYKKILGETCYPSLLEIPHPIEIVDIFRKPSVIPEIVAQAIQCKAAVVWMQSGIVNNEAAQMARDAGLRVVMDRCMMAEHKRLSIPDEKRENDH